MRWGCGTVAVLYLLFRWANPMLGWQRESPTVNGHSVTHAEHLHRHVALVPTEPHWMPAVKQTRAPVPEPEYERLAAVEGVPPGGAGTWVIPLRI
jgi:hypothetical protein